MSNWIERKNGKSNDDYNDSKWEWTNLINMKEMEWQTKIEGWML